MKDSFDAYMREIGKEPEKVWKAVEAAIQEVYLRTELSIVNLLSQYKTKQTYFEMVRFDFVIDEDLNVFIMEVGCNLSIENGNSPHTTNHMVFLFPLTGKYVTQLVISTFPTEFYSIRASSIQSSELGWSRPECSQGITNKV